MSNEDFKIVDRQIIVSDKYFGKDKLNDFFSVHKLKDENYTDKDITMLIDSVAYYLDYINGNIGEDYVENSDFLIIEKLLD